MRKEIAWMHEPFLIGLCNVLKNIGWSADKGTEI